MTKLDVEALEAATDAVRARNMVTLDAPQPSGPVEVKPLDWKERVGVDGTFDAYTSIGHYIATITDDDRGMWFAVGLTQSNYCAPDIDIAKAAAQADYERRILSALEPADTATDVEPVACVERGSEQSTPQPESRLREARLREAAREAVNCVTHHAEDNENTRWVLSLLNAALKETSE